jgi:hypothetical protein
MSVSLVRARKEVPAPALVPTKLTSQSTWRRCPSEVEEPDAPQRVL